MPSERAPAPNLGNEEAETREEAERLAVLAPETPARRKHALPGAEDEEARERNLHPFDAPEEFVRADRLIREDMDGVAPKYAANYRMAAERALGLVNDKGSFIQPVASSAAMGAQGIVAITERGPGNVSGRTRAILPNPTAPATTWIVGSVGGGIWKTTNAGASWTLLTQDLASIAVASLAQSAANPSVIYAGTGEGFGNTDGFGGEGIFKSTDGGVTWTQLAATTRFNGFAAVNRLIASPNSPDSVVAATNVGIYRTVNGGATWTQTYVNGTNRIQQVIANPSNWRIQYATVNGATNGVVKSVDAGATWALSNTGIAETGNLRYEIAIAPSLTSTLYAQVEAGTSTTRHYISTNSGASWTLMTGTSTNVLNGQGWYNNTIAVDPINPSHVYVAGLDFYDMAVAVAVKTLVKRTDWAASISATNYVHADHHNITVVPNGAGVYRILSGTDGGVAYSDDAGLTWTKTLTGYNSSQPYGADKQTGANRFITGLQDNGTWVSPTGATASSSWTGVLGGDGFFNLWHRSDPNKLMGAIQYNNFYRSLDGGTTWTGAMNGLTDVGSGLGLFISNLAKSTITPDLVLAPGANGIWRSADFGGTWAKATVNSGKWFPVTSRGYVVASPADSRVVWAAGRLSQSTSPCTSAIPCTVMRSTDGGLSFSRTQFTGMTNIGQVSGLAAHPTDPNTAYLLFSFAGIHKVLRTTDGGTSWANLSGTFAASTTPVSTNGFPNVAVYDLLVMPYDTNVLWVATEVGLVISSDGGATWARPTFSFPNVGIWSMRIVDDQVVVATHGRGVWTVQFSELAGYTPPIAPALTAAAQAPGGRLSFTFSRPTPYDSLRIIADGVILKRYGANAAPTSSEMFSVSVSIPTARTDTASVIGYKNGGQAYYSAAQVMSLLPVATPVVTASADGSTTTGFTASGITSSTIAGFTSASFNTPHSYSNNAGYSLLYGPPVIVAQTGATIVYDDIAHVEPCNDDATYCATNYYDYVTVEATKDGTSWITLTKYDSRYDATWEAGYASAPLQTAYRTHTINLLTVQAPAAQPTEENRPGLNPLTNRSAAPAFATGDTILVRWRMATDGSVVGWGWTIDNIKIQENGVLPIELADFNGVWDGDRVRLSWKTASETNNALFSIERETGPSAWAEVGTRPGAGTTSTEKTYTFDDPHVPFGAERVRYRLRQVDFDGTASYSAPLEVALGVPTVFQAYDAFPNPVRTHTTLRYALPHAASVRIEVYDVTGRRVAVLVDEVQDAGRREVLLDTAVLAQGTYLVRITAGSDTATRTISVVR